ncbi:MAG: VCBS repeat-containing protein [Armatimonadetes bacterium]|nr:VCBS repeat-containing protein [Armatimonadota bacterium]
MRVPGWVVGFYLVLLLAGCSGGGANLALVLFAEPQEFAVGDTPRMLARGDYNGDSLDDVASANSGDNTVTVLINTTRRVASTPAPSGTATALASPSTTPRGTPTPTPSVALVTFSTFTFDTGTGPRSIDATDGDGDSLVDIVTGNSDGTVSVLINTTTSGTSQPTFTSSFDFSAANASEVCFITTGDGLPDIVSANAVDNTISVLVNITSSVGVPNFSGPFTFNTGTAPFQPLIVDLNGDTDPDIANLDSGGNLNVLLSSGLTAANTPNFQNVRSYSLGATASSMVARDMDDDGAPDVVAATTDGNATILRNTTPAVVATPTPASTPRSSSSGTSTAPQLSFAEAAQFDLQATPSWIAASDFAQSDSVDLITADATDNNVSTLVNRSTRGNYAFRDGGRFEAGTTPVFVMLMDVDGDGQEDAVVVNRDVDQVSVLINKTTTTSTSNSLF